MGRKSKPEYKSPYVKPDKPTQRRKCLKCRVDFDSSGNRICPKCTQRNRTVRQDASVVVIHGKGKSET